MSKVEASSIPAILDAIVGSTSANGDTYLDDESLRNVEKLEAVCGWVCDRIHMAYSGDYPKQCASAEKVASAVRRSSGFILDYMSIDRDWLLALADEMDTCVVDRLNYLGEAERISGREYADCVREALGVEDG